MELAKIITVRIVVNFRKALYMYNYCIIIHACTCTVVDKPKESDCGMLKPEALIMQDTLEQHTDSLGNQLLKK